MLKAGYKVGRYDVIDSRGGNGYRYADQISVRFVRTKKATGKVNLESLNERQTWVIEKLQTEFKLQIGDIMTKFGCTKPVARAVMIVCSTLVCIASVGIGLSCMMASYLIGGNSNVRKTPP